MSYKFFFALETWDDDGDDDSDGDDDDSDDGEANGGGDDHDSSDDDIDDGEADNGDDRDSSDDSDGGDDDSDDGEADNCDGDDHDSDAVKDAGGWYCRMRIIMATMIVKTMIMIMKAIMIMSVDHNGNGDCNAEDTYAWWQKNLSNDDQDIEDDGGDNGDYEEVDAGFLQLRNQLI